MKSCLWHVWSHVYTMFKVMLTTCLHYVWSTVKSVFEVIPTPYLKTCLTLIRRGGGQICPTDFQTLIPLEPNIRLTWNQALNSSLSVVSRSKKKLTNSDHERTLARPFSRRVPAHFPLFMAWPKWKWLLAIFLHSLQHKWDQRTLGRQRSTLIGSRTHLGPSIDPAMAL